MSKNASRNFQKNNLLFLTIEMSEKTLSNSV